MSDFKDLRLFLSVLLFICALCELIRQCNKKKNRNRANNDRTCTGVHVEHNRAHSNSNRSHNPTYSNQRRPLNPEHSNPSRSPHMSSSNPSRSPNMSASSQHSSPSGQPLLPLVSTNTQSSAPSTNEHLMPPPTYSEFFDHKN